MNRIISKIARECSVSSGPINDLDLVHLRPYVESFLDSNWLEQELIKYENWASANSDPFLQRNNLHHPLGMNLLVAMIWAARSWEAEYKTDPNFHPQGGANRLINIACNMAVLELHAKDWLDATALKYMQQRLQAAGNFLGMVHEINTFAFFIRKGASVQPKFLKIGSQQEISVKWDGYIIPVQCKAKQPGAGRLISQDTFTTLAGSVAFDARISRQSILVRIGTTGTIRQQDISFLRDQVKKGVGRDIAPAIVQNDKRIFTVSVQTISGQFTVESVTEYLSSFNFHMGMIVGEPDPNGIDYHVVSIIGIDAKIDDNLRSSRSLRKSIKDGARQLRNGPPGIVAIHYVDPTEDFESLRSGGMPIRFELERIMEPWSDVAAIMLSSEQDFQIPGVVVGGEVRSYVKKTCKFADLLGEPV
ncbi:MAG: hypothetical protein GY845_18025 [Planctomycetes bacterium]|nr:hypothetical protein [Planctomycetota bacterium]